MPKPTVTLPPGDAEDTKSEDGSETQNVDSSTTNADDPYTMTEEMLRKRKGRRYNGRFITQFYACFVACLGSIIFGMTLGWSSPAFNMAIDNSTDQDVLKKDISQSNFPVLASLVPLGIVIGVPVWNYISPKLGPKKTLIIQNMFSFIIWVTLGSPVIHQSLAMALRFFCGFMSICNLICGETLLIDAIDIGYWRDFNVLFKSFIYFGVLLIHLAGHVKHRGFSYLTVITIVFHTIFLLISPESPVFLFNFNERKAIRAVKWYRGKVNINTEVQTLKKNADFRKLNTYSNTYILYSKVVVKGIIIVVGLCLFQVFTGYYAFIFFKSMIFHRYGEIFFSPYLDSIIFGVSLLVGRALSTRIHHTLPFGARKPLIISTLTVAITLALIATYCFLYEFKFKFVMQWKWFPLLSVIAVIACYEIGLSIMPDILIYDYMPCQVYAQASTIVTCSHWFMVTIMTYSFTFVAYHFKRMSYIFCLSFAFAIMGFFYTLIFVVETKNKPLVQIQLAIGGNPIGNRSLNRKQRKSRMIN